MAFPVLVYTVLADADVSVATDAIADSGTSSVVTGTFENFINADLMNVLCTHFAETLAIGFALTTLLILITYGAFKALSLVRIN